MANGKKGPKLNRTTGTPKPRTPKQFKPPKLNREPVNTTDKRIKVQVDTSRGKRWRTQENPNYKPPGNGGGNGGGGSNGGTDNAKEKGWWSKKVDGKTGQDKVVAGLSEASDLMGSLADRRNAAMSGLVGGTGGVGEGAAASSSGVVRQEDYEGYTKKKRKLGLDGYTTT